MDKRGEMNWDHITTIAEFDTGNISQNGAFSTSQNTCFDTASQYENRRRVGVIAAHKPKTTISLLIESLIKLICNTFEKDPVIADKSYKAICEELYKIKLVERSYLTNEFESIRSQYQKQIYKILCAVKGQELPISFPALQTENAIPSEDEVWSRYRRDFEEMHFIAGGTFGRVFKARHKLDSMEYAIKQIKINSTTIKLSHLAEVKTIASLSHPNVVQYKAAWLEPYLTHNRSLNVSESFQSSSATNSTSSLSDEHNENDELEASSSDYIKFLRSHPSKSLEEVYSNKSGSDNALCEYRNGSIETYHIRAKAALLYIQMDLCQWNLRDWLDQRNKSSTFEKFYAEFFSQQNPQNTHLNIVNDIFCQLLSGLNYIHMQKIVHHDIKPKNIFLVKGSDEKIIVKLGDFGLACPLQCNHHGSSLGTPLYAAPEQLNGECNPKSDVYSLGIVLIELLLKFTTYMERTKVIEAARAGQLPAELDINSKKLIQSLLSHERIRPGTKKLLEAITAINNAKKSRSKKTVINDVKRKFDGDKEESCIYCQELRNKLEEKERLIQLHRAEMASKNEEIKQLKVELAHIERILTYN